MANFIVEFPLKTEKYQEDILNKRFEIGRKIYFGEMTFTSAGGYDDEIPNDLDVEMGEKMNLPLN